MTAISSYSSVVSSNKNPIIDPSIADQSQSPVKVAANPQGGMADPNVIIAEAVVDDINEAVSGANNEDALVGQLAKLDLANNNTTNTNTNNDDAPSITAANSSTANRHPVQVASSSLGLTAGGENQHHVVVLQQQQQQYRRPINHVKIPANMHDNRKLFVGGLPTNLSEITFLEFFEQFGDVIDSVVMIDRQTKRSRGFGFVTFADEGVARSLLTTIPGKTGVVNIMGKSCEIKASEPKAGDALPSSVGHYNQRQQRGVGAGAGIRWENHTRDLDARNFDELYPGGGVPPTASSSMYHHGYRTQGAGAGGYPYYQTSAGYHHASNVPSSWEASYPNDHSANSYGYGQYVSSAGGGEQGGAYGHHPYYAATQGQYSQYGGANSMYHPHMMQGQGVTSSTGYSGYYDSATGMPSQGAHASDGSLESYPQSYFDPNGALANEDQY
mmetsp:Transcript_14947/g.32314  ORF Transcript_14947/g.32314 Transcript_14947/m.32314 type:complete len:442 (-) Transcript_14947:2533-3858(-)